MLTHEVMDPYHVFEDDHEALLLKCALISFPMMLWQLFMVVTNINTLFSAICLGSYLGTYMWYNSNFKEIKSIIPYISAMSVLIFLFGILLFHLFLKNTKEVFMNQSKIIRILDEQKMLLDNISDGAMIYRLKKSETRDAKTTGTHDIGGEESESKQEI